MSRIDDLLAQHCPNGVESRRLKEVARIRNGRDYKGFNVGNVPVYGTGGVMTFIDTPVYDRPSVLIPRKGSLNKLYFVDQPFWTVDTIFYTEIFEHMLPKFFYYFLQTQHLEDLNQAGGVPSLTQSVLNELRVPVPPLEVQREIVRILDMFTALEAELEAELEARRRQYAHYRDALVGSSQGKPSLTLGDLGVIYGGLTGKSKPDFNAWGNSSFVTYVDVFGGISTVAGNGRVEIKPGERQNQVRRGDILFTASSESVEEVGMSSAVTREPSEPLYLNSFCFGFRPHGWVSLNPEFAKHLFRSEGIRRQIVRTASGVTRFNVSKERFRRVLIPLPSPEEQLRLAASLDQFDALANDLSIGLPAELAARRKQYEYYRDRLLSFEEAPA